MTFLFVIFIDLYVGRSHLAASPSVGKTRNSISFRYFFKDVARIRDLTTTKKVITRTIQIQFTLVPLVSIDITYVLLQNWVHQIIHNAVKKNQMAQGILFLNARNKTKKFSVVEFPNFDLNHFQFMNTFKNIVKQMLSSGKC